MIHKFILAAFAAALPAAQEPDPKLQVDLNYILRAPTRKSKDRAYAKGWGPDPIGGGPPDS
jgi:hypothetical protein